MIKSKTDYLNYLEADRIALKKANTFYQKTKDFFYPDYIWDFQKCLRKLEFYYNCKRSMLGKIYLIFLKIKFRKKSLKLGFSIPANVFGPGLAIVHYGTIVVNPNAKVGSNCRIHPCTNIGASGGNPEAPQIGDNVYIGPGAKIYGNIQLGNNIAIAANSSVNKSFIENDIMIAGSPAKKIKIIDIKSIIPHA
ncbi:serine acetyltransferase [uncultured Maribacter sp.]|uniref:serine O-acetyltransferase n=1 Tax=uncultured Maribacter sp. TaxID=431308 RepID=UPI0030EF7171|tara:strand:+ start:45666 stop:46244 length:579 start_codon:yes stop_codon:yes gene_type:complete